MNPTQQCLRCKIPAENGAECVLNMRENTYVGVLCTECYRMLLNLSAVFPNSHTPVSDFFANTHFEENT